ncbi:MAG: glycosyltransferase [Nitrosomonadales bacterium]|nr:glycosyltransferase [Nitrosomonadales bacterium]
MFTIIIPTWNNLEFLKLCVHSIRTYSDFEHEIIIHVNGGSDGTLEWVKSEGIKFSHTDKNVGICIAVNHLVTLASHDWVLYLNDDMVACPGWDTAFAKAIETADTDLALFFSTLIQADIGKSPYIIKQDFGSSPENFDEPRLMKEYLKDKRGDAEGAASQPTLFHKKWWSIVGGYSVEFSPGMSSDDDLLMKFWVIGCRHYRVVGASRFYHFSCKSTGRIRHNMGGRIFAMKWGITQKEFFQKYLASLNKNSASNATAASCLPNPFPRTTLKGKFRRAGYGLFHDYPLGDIEAWDGAAGVSTWKGDADAANEASAAPAPSPHGKQSWLILSHAYNMDGRAASQTITDKIPHLLEHGIRPIIVSGILGYKEPVLEHHQVLPALAVGLRFDLRHFLKNRLSSHLLYRLALLAVTLLTFPLYLLEKLIIPIETTWSWAISAYLVSRRIIRSEHPALVYSTGGAYAAHIAGFWLSKRFGIPWIAEIHDPMVIASTGKPSIREKFSMWLEKKICTRADIVWWFTEKAMERAQQRHPQLGERGHFVLPGVDDPGLKRTPYRRQQHFVISHFGSLSETRNLRAFLEALGKLIGRDTTRAARVRLHIFGGSLDPVSAEAIEAFPYPEVIENFGRLEADPITGESGRTQVLQRMNAADCLLLLHGTEAFSEEYIPSKFYEYLWTQRPILGLIHRNPQLTGLLHEFNHRSVEELDIDDVAQALEELYQLWSEDRLGDNHSITPYTTKNAVDTIVGWTDRMLSSRSACKVR